MDCLWGGGGEVGARIYAVLAARRLFDTPNTVFSRLNAGSLINAGSPEL